MNALLVPGKISLPKLIVSTILQDEQQMKKNIIQCHEKEQQTELELADLVSQREKKLAEMEELKVRTLISQWRVLDRSKLQR